MTWDITTPSGSEALSNGDDRIRELKADVQTALRGNASDGTEAKFPGADTANPIFRYRGLKGVTASRPASGQYGLYANTTLNTLQRDNGSSWEDIATLIPSGTVMVFYQAAAPVGWTKATTQNDKALRVVSASGGGAGGSLAVSTGMTHTHAVDGHTHSIASASNHTHSTPNHTHLLDGGTAVEGAVATNSGLVRKIVSVVELGTELFVGEGTPSGGSGLHYKTYSGQTTSSGADTSGAGGSHDHGAVTGSGTSNTDSQSPVLAYIDVILCSKD